MSKPNVQIAIISANDRYEKIEARMSDGTIVVGVWERGHWKSGSLCMIETDNTDAEIALVQLALDARDRGNMAANVSVESEGG